MDPLRGFALLLLCQSAGEALSRGAQLPLPGPVIGLLLLWALLNVPSLRAPTAAAAEPLLQHLSLLFVPVGVGVVTHLALLGQYGGRMLATIVLSTWAGMTVTALVLRALWPAATAEAVEALEVAEAAEAAEASTGAGRQP